MKSPFDAFATDPAWQPTINERYEGGLVYPSFSDQYTWYEGEALIYVDAYAIKVASGTNKGGATLNDVLRDASGNFCYIPWGNPYPQYAGDIGDQGFRDGLVDYIVSKLVPAHPQYKGVYLDDVNLDISRVACGFDTAPRCDVVAGTNCPVDPRTGQLMTNEDWVRYVVEFTEQVEAALPNHLTAHNTIWYIRDFADPLLLRQIQAADYVEMEQGFIDGGLTSGSGKYSWSRKMDFVDLVRANGAEIINHDDNMDTVAEQKYGLANYFLHSSNTSFYGSEWISDPDDDSSVWGANIGSSLGPRYTWFGLQRRDFSGGFTLVHPPGGSPITVNLGGTFTDLWGASMSSITLSEREGTVFRGS